MVPLALAGAPAFPPLNLDLGDTAQSGVQGTDYFAGSTYYTGGSSAGGASTKSNIFLYIILAVVILFIIKGLKK